MLYQMSKLKCKRSLYSRLANNVPKKENKGEEKDKTWQIFVGEPTKLISEFLENCMRTLEAEAEKKEHGKDWR